VPRQKLGQHFLVRGSILERIAAVACPTREKLVVEIGAGRGALTEKLLKRAERVIAIELDPYLAAHLRRKFAGQPLEVIEADALSVDLGAWGRAPIAGNLPYAVAAPIIEKTLRLAPPRAVFLVQKEVALRLAAAAGSRDYGFLTVQTALFAGARRLFDVAPAAFYPPPKVDSSVVLLEPRTPAVADPDAFLAFAGQCFRHKRKTIRNNLAPVYGKERIAGWPEAGRRAEQLSLDQFLEMYRRL